MAVKSIGVKISHSSTQSGTYEEITGLQEIPDLGGAPDKIDITTLADTNYKYMSGVKDFGDLDFTFLFDDSSSTSNYQVCHGLEEQVEWFKVEFDNAITSGTSGHGSQFTFCGECSTRVNGMGVNAAAQFVLNVALQSDITYTPAA